MASKSLNVKIPRLSKNRHGVYYVRSSALDATGRRRVLQQSLGTKDPHLAKILALKFCLTLAQGFPMSDPRDFLQRYGFNIPGVGSGHADGEEDHKRMLEAMEATYKLAVAQAQLAAFLAAHPEAADATPSQLPPPLGATQPSSAQLPSLNNGGYTLKAALDAHLADETNKGLLTDQTLSEKRAVYSDFSDLFGLIQLNQITKADITARWRAAEFARPNKKHKGRTLGLNRIEKRRSYLSKFFNWARDGGLYFHEQPMGLRMATKKEIKAKTQSYSELSGDDVKLLFSKAYLDNMHKPDWYWLPLMSLFCGARLSELANLPLDRFKEVEGIKIYRIDAVQEEESVKTTASKRTVPIHSTLLDLGLWDYVESLRARGAEFLLPHRPVACRGKSVGDQWGKWIDRCGVKDTQMVFHSFRSTVVTNLHSAGAGHAHIRQITGHATSGTSGAHGGYVRGLSLTELKQAIEKLAYPTIDFALLKLPDPTFTLFFKGMVRENNDALVMAKAQKLENHLLARQDRLARLAKSRNRKPKDGGDQ